MKEIYLFYILIALAVARLVITVAPKLIPNEEIRLTCREYLDSFVVAGAVALLLVTYVVRSFYIPSESMVPTLQVNDYILVNKFVYKMATPMRGDIIVFNPPDANNPGQPSDIDYIKRVVAVENDEILISGGILYLNGQPQDEAYIKAPALEDFGPYRVPAGHLFMMGDNRNNSLDSRIWGPLPISYVEGKAFVVFWPFSRCKILRRGE